MNQKPKLSVNLAKVPVETSDAEFRLRSARRILMVISTVVEGKRDNEQAPSPQRIVSLDTAK